MTTKELIEKIIQDEQLQKQFAGINQPEKFYEVAKEKGLTDDFETMKESALKFVKEQFENEEIDLKELSECSGGVDVSDIAIASISATVAGGTLAICASI